MKLNFDIKLQRFLPDRLSNDEKQLCAKLLRQLRNKIAHGDFIAFEEKIEEYAIRFWTENLNLIILNIVEKTGLLNMFVVY